MWEGVPEAVSVIVFFILMSVVGLLEGMQIAFFAVAKIPKAERGDHKFAKMTCDLLFKGKGHNLPGFMIGRQLCVVSCFFIIARVTTLDVEVGDENIFGVSDGLQRFFNTGLAVPSSQRSLGLSHGSLWRRPSLSPSCPTRLSTSSSASVCSWRLLVSALVHGFSLRSTRRFCISNAMKCTLEPPRNVLPRRGRSCGESAS